MQYDGLAWAVALLAVLALLVALRILLNRLEKREKNQ